MQNLHVTIVGAGLGGLCLAQALKHAGIAFDVFERDAAPESRGQGYRIRINAEGQHALEMCLPPELYTLFRLTASVAASTGRFLTPQLAPVSGRVPDSWHTSVDGESADEDMDLSVDRQTLREILMCGIKDHLHFGQVFDRYTLTDDSFVEVFFQQAAGPVVSHILVGADGVNSRVRAQLVPEAEPIDTGSCCIYGKTYLQEADTNATLYQGTSVIFADGYATILDEMRFRGALPALASRIAPECILTPVADYLYWAMTGPRNRFGLESSGQPIHCKPELHEVLLSVTQDWHPSLQQLVRGCDLSTIAMLPVRNGRPEVQLPAGPVTLLWDAIHAMSPAGGLGANTALKDASVFSGLLAEAVSGRGKRGSVLSCYATKMREWATKAVVTSSLGAARLFGI